MKKPIEEHAARFDEAAAEYDDDQSDEYKACVELVVEHARARLSGTEAVLDIGTGTGAIALRLAEGPPADDESGPTAGRVYGRDVSEGMLDEARGKAADRGLETVEFGEGTFREPNYDGEADVVVSNFAMHHLSDDEKREAIDVLAGYDPDRVVLGDVMFFGGPDPDEPFYSPAVDDPATVGVLVDAFTDAGFVVSAVEMVHEQVGVLVADDPATLDPDAAGPVTMDAGTVRAGRAETGTAETGTAERETGGENP